MPFASPVADRLVPYECVGPEDAPVIVALGGISAHRHVCANADDPSPGWWDRVAGPGRALNTSRYRVVGCDYLDGGSGADGRPAHTVTTHDQADAIVAVLDALDVACARAVVGASYGGMVALAFADRYPERLERLVVISAAHQPHPMITALRSIQRQIVELGLETGRARDALVLARGLGMTTYRTIQEFSARFDTAPERVTQNSAGFPVERYLRHQGERFADRFTPARFLALSLSNDLHAVDPARITAPTVLIAAEEDSVAPRQQLEQLAREIAGPCELVDLTSMHGHDAFLVDAAALAPLLESALDRSNSGWALETSHATAFTL